MYATRTKSVIERLAGTGADALLVTTPVNYLYLSGFRGSAGCLLLSPRGRFIITDFRYHERVKREVDASYELQDMSGLPLTAVLPALLERLGANRLGFEAETMTFAQYHQLKGLAGVELLPTISLVDELRAIKEPGEVAAIRASQHLTERIYTELLPLIGPGVTEADLAAEVEYRALKYGATACSFSPIIASGPNAAQPHAGFSRQELLPGAPLIIDIGVVLDDYCSDMTRTVFYRDCPPEWERIYGIVRAAKDLAFTAIKPGVRGADVDKVARDYITQAGYGAQFRHGLGHGVGLPFKGAPVLHWSSPDVLVAGNVASNEPGIYLPGQGGVRIEDLFVVTPTGAEYLNELGTELTVVGG